MDAIRTVGWRGIEPKPKCKFRCLPNSAFIIASDCILFMRFNKLRFYHQQKNERTKIIGILFSILKPTTRPRWFDKKTVRGSVHTAAHG